MELRGRRAVVTGAGGGLGAVLARALAAEGMHVVVADVDGQAARRVAGELDGTPVTADLSTDGGVEAVVAAAGSQADVLINCAGGWHPSGRCYGGARSRAGRCRGAGPG